MVCVATNSIGNMVKQVEKIEKNLNSAMKCLLNIVFVDCVVMYKNTIVKLSALRKNVLVIFHSTHKIVTS